MNKLITALVFLLSVCSTITAQVGIGTTTPETSAALDVSSTDKGFLMPRMTTSQREAILNPVNSLTVFDTDTKTFWSYIEGFWIQASPGVGKFIDGATPDIAFYPESVGIGLNNVSSAFKLYVEGVNNTDGIQTTTRTVGIYEGTGTSEATKALETFAINNSTGTINYGIGSDGYVENENAGGTINYAVGTWPKVNNSGNIGYAAGITAVTTNNSGSMNLVRGQDISVFNVAGATMTQPSLGSMWFSNEGTITGDGYGLFIGGTGSGSVGGNSYALYVATPFSNVAGDAFAIYSDNINDSYIEGNLGIGTNDPLQKVHISGVMRLEPQAAEPSGDMGDFYVKSDGVLYFHNGAGWKAVQLAP